MALLAYFQNGGAFMVPILMAGIAAAWIAFDRYKALFKDNSASYDSLWSQVQPHIQSGNIAEAIRVCESSPSIYSSVIRAGLTRATRDEQQIQNAIDVAVMKSVPSLQSKLGHLSLIANVATLLGLLGTISGLILAFAAVANADASQKQTLLANGISVAMNTTQFGLIIAVPTMVLHGWLSARARKITVALTQLTTEVVDALSGRLFDWMEAGQTTPSSSANLKREATATTQQTSPLAN